MKKLVLIAFITVIILFGGFFLFKDTNTSQSMETTQDARKSIEQYFVEHMGASPEEAKKIAENGVDLRVSEGTAIMGIVGNLYYYGFIDNEEAFTKLLKSTKDTTSGKEGAIKIGNNTIDINTNYYVNYEMTDQEIADTLLNKGKYQEDFNRYNYLFMPSGKDTKDQTRPLR